MMAIRAIYQDEPAFPASDQHPDAVRYFVAGHFVDAVGREPTEGEVISAIEPEPGPYHLYKSNFISRLTGPEAETMEAVLAAADAKLRLMFNSVEYFVSDDPLFATMSDAIGAALTPERAAQLLAA